MRAMFHAAEIDETTKNQLWAECANMQRYVRSRLITGDRDEPSYELFFGEKPKARKAIQFGRT